VEVTEEAHKVVIGDVTTGVVEVEIDFETGMIETGGIGMTIRGISVGAVAEETVEEIEVVIMCMREIVSEIALIVATAEVIEEAVTGVPLTGIEIESQDVGTVMHPLLEGERGAAVAAAVEERAQAEVGLARMARRRRMRRMAAKPKIRTEQSLATRNELLLQMMGPRSLRVKAKEMPRVQRMAMRDELSH